MEQSERAGFIKKFITASFTPEEQEEFVSWVKQAGKDELEAAWELYAEMDANNPDHEPPPAVFREALERRLDLTVRPAQVHRFRRYAAAAAVLVATAGLATFFLMNREDKPADQTPPVIAKIDLPPGGNKATLTLSGGRTIPLDDIPNGKLAMENGVNIQKNADGQLFYAVTGGSEKTDEPIYNTISTPKGGQYQVSLPDGSIIWLNAASSLSFPVNFTGKQRKVSITGEAYFDIKKNREQPFIVQSGNQEVEVLGTEFNINSYLPGAISTSLLEGSVKVINTNSRQQVVLQPGSQAILNSQEINTRGFNADNVTSWRKGLFSYTNASLNTVMNDFERWYDVEVVYTGNIPEFDFTGDIPRKLKASQFLEIMSSYPVKFSLEAIGDKQRLTVSAR
ncbi:FecR family protein [Pseudoflavitalea rhizosphaerae]|uniref:FecR family protein n=1 Tax=Pseudoflavitalea rhizosphaerae TaxID=1884793 RepID=UPI000F8C7BE2|nr:FecR family protein [Pseudoflavitalea rhizosphaerae]